MMLDDRVERLEAGAASARRTLWIMAIVACAIAVVPWFLRLEPTRRMEIVARSVVLVNDLGHTGAVLSVTGTSSYFGLLTPGGQSAVVIQSFEKGPGIGLYDGGMRYRAGLMVRNGCPELNMTDTMGTRRSLFVSREGAVSSVTNEVDESKTGSTPW